VYTNIKDIREKKKFYSRNLTGSSVQIAIRLLDRTLEEPIKGGGREKKKRITIYFFTNRPSSQPTPVSLSCIPAGSSLGKAVEILIVYLIVCSSFTVHVYISLPAARASFMNFAPFLPERIG